MLWLVYIFHVDKGNARQQAGAMGYNPTVEEWEFLNPAGQAQGWLVISTWRKIAARSSQMRPKNSDRTTSKRISSMPPLG
jgi:tRNA A58 N-methylase Trm61